eukprot:373762-Rhodomonas_salina.3
MLAKRKFYMAKVREKLGKAPTRLLDLGDEFAMCHVQHGKAEKRRENMVAQPPFSPFLTPTPPTTSPENRNGVGWDGMGWDRMGWDRR